MTTIVLADDHPVVRKGLRTLLESEPDFSIVGEADDGLETVQIVERLQPQVLILDVMMPSINGLEVARTVKKRSPKTCIVMLSMYADEAYVQEALRAGARAYILKETGIDELIRAIREAVAGHRYLSPPLSERAIEIYTQMDTSKATDAYDNLSDRERQVLSLIVEGFTNAEIAEQLYLSPRTIEGHRTNIMRKLKTRTTAELIRYTLKRGIFSKDR